MEHMNIQRFREIVEAYGADPARWPAAEREMALEFQHANAQSQFILSEAVELDQMLSQTQAPMASDELSQIILAQGLDVISKANSAVSSTEEPNWFGTVIADVWNGLFLPVRAPAAALWVLVAVAGAASGAMVTDTGIADEELISFYGENESSWVEQFQPEIDATEGEGV